MHNLGSVDGGNKIDWGNTSSDYGMHRPGPPESFYKKLQALDVGLAGQAILDLGTGTGLLARKFAKAGCEVSATDISDGQITMAKELAENESLKIEFHVAGAEKQPFDDQSFDVITANQCFLYFDKAKAIPEIKRLLKPEGVFVTSHNCWIPERVPLAQKTEEIILDLNPKWTAAGYQGHIPPIPEGMKEHFVLKSMFYYDEEIPFTKETWRGRMRTCRGVGASLSNELVQEFDRRLSDLLDEFGKEEFTVLHRMDAHIYALEY